jgi:TolB-like protein/Tfp pilus assembly protein PilF
MGVLAPPPIRFGPFEVNTRSGELLRQGLRLRLRHQQFQVLALLLEHPGEVVTREELRKRLWPDDIVVDFDCGLNKAINGVRAALRDRAEKPRFIETLPKRGYRFIAPVELAAPVVERTLAADSSAPPRCPQRIESLAVLPLDNLSDDPGQEYFSDGMTDELIAALARIDSLRVISRTSVMTYKGTRKSLRTIARELRVDAIVEGSVARSGQRVRITTQLIHAPTDKHLWSERYERELRDILQLQAEIAHGIASQIQKLVDPKHSYPVPQREVHPQAYEAYLKGIYFRDKMTSGALERSIGFFAEAIDLDPTYAHAYSELSRAHFFLGLFGVRPPKDTFPKARETALRALELDESVVTAHIALGAIHVFYDWDWAGGEAKCRHAVELNPGQSLPHFHLADYMSIQGRHEEAIAEYRRGLELDPLSPQRRGHFGLILHRARQYDESIAQCRKALDIDSTYVNALWFLALSLEQRGELAEAIAALRKAVRLSGGPHFQALLARAHALAGERAKALRILGKLKEMSRRTYISPFDLAVVHAGLGEQTLTFEWLEQAYKERVWRIIEVTLPMFDGLRSDPRWHDLVRRIGLRQ